MFFYGKRGDSRDTLLLFEVQEVSMLGQDSQAP